MLLTALDLGANLLPFPIQFQFAGSRLLEKTTKLPLEISSIDMWREVPRVRSVSGKTPETK